MALSRRELMHNAGALSALAGLSACGPTTATTATTASDALGNLDATGVAARIRNREITAVEALDAALARVAKVNPQLNFIAAPAEAFGRTRAAQALTGPFAGVPTLIKDLTSMTGMPLEFGCRAFDGNVAQQQSPYADAILAMGVVPFGKSTTPEFGLTATTESTLVGATHNPWNTALSSGGSSGGSAAAVASGAVPIASGSDGGGSIRIPSSCCGLFGLKVSRDRNQPSGTPDPGISLSVAGCLSRTVRDTAAWLAATEMQGPSAKFTPVGMVTGPNTQRLRIKVIIQDTLHRDPHPHVKAAIEGVAELCTSLGHHVTSGAFTLDGEAFSNAFTLVWAAGAAEVDALAQRLNPGKPRDQLLEPLTIGLSDMFHAAPRGAMQRAVTLLRQVEALHEAMYSDCDVILTPVLAATPPRLGEIAPQAGMAGFAKVRDYVTYTPLQNAAGAPAMSVPLSVSPDGLPIGAHFAAPKGQEERLLELAYELEHASPWADRRPSVWAG